VSTKTPQERSLHDLLNAEDPAWTAVERSLQSASNLVEILTADPMDGQRAIQAIQAPVNTTMGAVALNAGGLLVDHGWLRVLGAGHQRLPGSLLDWNGLGQTRAWRTVSGALVVAWDVIGGVFAVNGGGLPGPEGLMSYYAPDHHRWVETGFGYTSFLDWCAEGDLAGFYNHLRWADWEEDVLALRGDQAIHLWPQPWMISPFDPDGVARRVVAADALPELVFTGRSPQLDELPN
jgi:hypothetical protein